jgi:hypothetical protein
VTALAKVAEPKSILRASNVISNTGRSAFRVANYRYSAKTVLRLEATRLPSEIDGVSSGGVLTAIGTRAWKENAHCTLWRQKATIRRSSQCDIHVNDPTVSRVHGEPTWANRELVRRHLSEVNPTYPATSSTGARKCDGRHAPVAPSTRHSGARTVQVEGRCHRQSRSRLLLRSMRVGPAPLAVLTGPQRPRRFQGGQHANSGTRQLA